MFHKKLSNLFLLGAVCTCSATAGTWLKFGVKRVYSIRRLVTFVMIATDSKFRSVYINIVVGNFPFVVCNIFVLIRLLVARSPCRDSCACMHRSCSGCNIPGRPLVVANRCKEKLIQCPKIKINDGESLRKLKYVSTLRLTLRANSIKFRSIV